MLREIVYFYENNENIFNSKFEVHIDKLNTIFLEDKSNLKNFKNIIKKIICQVIIYKYTDELSINIRTS